jgi:hypothetical protein
MGIPDPNLENYLVSSARDRAAELVTSFATVHGADGEADTLCVHVNALFEDYCGGLLEGLRNAVLPVEAAEARWVRDHYVPLMVEFATALRDSIADSKARHAAAQLIQCKVLEHERELRVLLESAPAAAPTAQLASATPMAGESPGALNVPAKK